MIIRKRGGCSHIETINDEVLKHRHLLSIDLYRDVALLALGDLLSCPNGAEAEFFVESEDGAACGQSYKTFYGRKFRLFVIS